MTPEQLQAIEARWAKAIKGEYVVKKNYTTEIYLGPVKKCEFGFSHKGQILEMTDADCSDFTKAQINATATAIASAPTDIADLLAEVRRLQLAEKVCKLMQKNMGGHYCVVSKCDNCHTEEVGNAGEVCWTCIEKALKEWEAAGNG